MDTDSDNDNTGMTLTSNVLSFFCFMVTAYCMLKFFKPLQDAPMPEPDPGGLHIGRQEVLRNSDASNCDRFEDAGTERESSEEEGYEVRHEEWKESIGVQKGKTEDLFFSESDESGATDLSEQQQEEREEKQGEEGKEEEEEEQAESRSSRPRSRIPTTANDPTSPARSRKQRSRKRSRTPPPRLLQYGTDRYPIYDATAQNQGAAVVGGSSRDFGQYDGYALYINPNLKDTELEQIPHSGVGVDDLTASKLVQHYDRKILHARWPAEFDQKGMVPAERLGLGRAAKRWVNRGEMDVDGKIVEREGWYYLSWGGIHTLSRKEGVDANRYRIRPSYEKFKCPGLGFKISDWAEVQLAPDDPADPTFL